MEDVAVLRHLAGITRKVVRTNTDGITHAESLVAAEAGGNCMNWVVGHLLHTYELVLEGLKQPPVLGAAKVARYARGSAALRDPADALPFEQLLHAFDEAAERLEAALGTLTPELLERPAPEGFGRNLREMHAFIGFHQAYHAGQLGVLRRVAGREGAIA